MNTRDEFHRRGDRPVAPTVENMMMTSDLKPYTAYKEVVSQFEFHSPVAIFATLTAVPITSPGRFCPVGPLGI